MNDIYKRDQYGCIYDIKYHENDVKEDYEEMMKKVYMDYILGNIDQEVLHKVMDSLLIHLVNDYITDGVDIVKLYNTAREVFWYS